MQRYLQGKLSKKVTLTDVMKAVEKGKADKMEKELVKIEEVKK